jgi:hypothetical protein
MKYFFDLEFLEDGRTIDLISIGIIAEDGREFYAVCEENDWYKIANHQWLRENVLPYLPVEYREFIPGKWIPIIKDSPYWATKSELRERLLTFIGDDTPEWWAYYADYDWVCLAQLFGRMIDLPKGWPMYCRDIKQLADSVGNPQLPKQSGEHHALNDARCNKRAYDFLRDTNPWTKLLRNLNGKRVVAESDNPEYATIEYSVCLSNAELDRLRRLVA